VESAEQWDLTYLDLSSYPWQGFGIFRKRLLRKLAEAKGMDASSIDPLESLEDAVTALVRWNGRPTVAILDEFDYIAHELRKEDQAELRGALVNVSKFAVVVGTTFTPGICLEDIGDVVSDLAPIITISTPTLGGLRGDEARQLVGVGRTHQGLPPDAESEDLLIALAGCHPLLLQAGCYGWYSVVGMKTKRELAEGEESEAIERVRREVDEQMRFVSRGVGADARLILAGRSLELPTEVRERAHAELTALGLEPWALGSTRPGEMAGGMRLGADEVADPIDQLTSAVQRLNRRHQLQQGKKELVIRADALVGNDSVYLRRRVKSDEDFNRSIMALTRLLYDGTNAVVAQEERGTIKPTLPKCCYRDPRSVVHHLVALRNYYTHLPSQSGELAEKHLRSVGDVFELYCSRRDPKLVDLEQVRTGLLQAAVRLVIRLESLWPLEADPDAEAVFA
jgi:hypothetical protein